MAKIGIKESAGDVKRSKMGAFPNHIIERKRFTPNFVLHLSRIPRGNVSNNRNFFISMVLLFAGSNFLFIPIIPYLRHLGVSDGLIFATNISNFVATSLAYSIVSKDMRLLGCLGVLKRGIIIRLVIIILTIFCILGMSNNTFYVVLAFYTLIGTIWPYIYMASIMSF